MKFISTVFEQIVNQGNFSFFILIAAIVQIVLMVIKKKKE